MKGRTTITILLGIASVCAVRGLAQQPKVTPVPRESAPAAATAPPAAAATAKMAVVEVKPKAAKELDADEAYKANCSRCHPAPRKYSERKMATIMRHMRVRANLTEDETEAILRYLTK